MSLNSTCSRCGAPLKSDGFCTQCMLLEGLQETPPLESKRLRYFGDYELLEEIARGGMGVVYQARQTSLNRLVAIKMILSGQLATPSDLQRFRSEAQAAANLHHPSIVSIYEVGEHEGQHYFSMEYVAGKNLADVTREKPLPAREAARYLEIIARAIHYAHEQGTLHRDLKPSNVLIDQFGNPRVTDFGLAKRLEGDSDLTVTGQVLGSPGYMSPEQAMGRSRDVGVRSDVYGLGAILYHLLTGRPPFLAETLHATLEQVVSKEPAPLRILNPTVPADLQTICLKCLEKQPSQRYGSAEELAEDLHRYLLGEPIKARPASWVDRGVKWVRRRPAIAALSLSTVLVTLLGISGILLQWHKARQTAAREAYESYTAKVALAASKIEEGAHHRAEVILDSCPSSLRRWEWGYLKNVCQSAPKALEGHRQPITHLMMSADGHWLASADRDVVKLWDLAQGTHTNLPNSSDVRAVAFPTNSAQISLATINEVKRFDLATGRNIRTMRLAGWIATNSPDLSRVVCAQGTNVNELTLWDTVSSREIARLPKANGYRALHGAVADCLLMQVGAKPPETNTAVAIVNANTGEVTHRFALTLGYDDRVLLSPDRSKLFTLQRTGSQKDTARIWDVASRQEPVVLNKYPGRFGSRFGAVFSPGGEKLATWRASRTQNAIIEVWDSTNGQLISTFENHGAAIHTLLFSPDEKLMLSTDAEGGASVWHALTGEEVSSLEDHSKAIETAIFSPDGKQVIAAGRDKVIRVISLVGKTPSFTLPATVPQMARPAFSADGERIILLSIGEETIIKVWDAETGEPTSTIKQPGITMDARFCSDPTRLVTFTLGGATTKEAYEKRVATIWDVKKQQELHRFSADQITVSSDARWLIGLDADWIPGVLSTNYDYTKGAAKLTIWETESGLERSVHNFTNAIGASLSLDGEHFCRMIQSRASQPAVIGIYRAEDMELLGMLTNQIAVLGNVFVIPKAKRAIIQQWDRPNFPATKLILSLVDLRSGKFISELKVLRHDKEMVTPYWAAHLSPGNQECLLLQSKDSFASLFDTRNGKLVAELSGHYGVIRAAKFFPDGQRIITAGEDQTAKIWDATTGRELLSLFHAGAVSHLAVSSQGDKVLTVCEDGTASLFSSKHPR